MSAAKLPPSAAGVPESEWASLLAAARGGDDEALGQLCQRLRDYLRLAADRGLGGGLRAKFDASDVVQQTFLEAQQDFQRFTGENEAELRAWLVRLLEHNLTDVARQFRATQQRDLSREISIDAAGQRNKLPGPARTASSIVARRETDEELLRAVATLPERRRQIVELRHRRGLNYAEIGQEMGMSELAARKLWSRAIEDLRRALARPSTPKKPR